MEENVTKVEEIAQTLHGICICVGFLAALYTTVVFSLLGLGSAGDANGNSFDKVEYILAITTDNDTCEDLASALANDLDVIRSQQIIDRLGTDGKRARLRLCRRHVQIGDRAQVQPFEQRNELEIG